MKTVFSCLLILYACGLMGQDMDLKYRENTPYQLLECNISGDRLNLVLSTREGVTHLQPYKIYWKGSWHKLQVKKKRALVYIHTLPTPDKDFVMHADPRKEAGNQPPSVHKLPQPGGQLTAPILAYYEGKALYYSELKPCSAG